MTDQGDVRPDGTGRPRWGGFPGSGPVPDPAPAAGGPIGAYDPAAPNDPPTAPQFPVVPPPEDLTAPIPLVASAYEPPPPSRPRGSHRAAPAPAARGTNTWMRYLTVGGIAAVVVVGALYGFAACTSTDDVQVPVVPPVASTSPAPSASPSASPSPSTSPAASARPGATATSTPAASRSPRASASSSPRATRTPAAAARGTKQPVVVLNSTSVVGLAKRVADDIRAEGWTVPETANWRGGSVSATTIYYRPGAKNKASAELFKKTFDVATVVRPALPGMTSPLVLVLASDAA